MIDAVRDPATRQCLQFIVSDQQAHVASVVQSYDRVAGLLSDVVRELRETKSEVRSLKASLPPPSPLSPLYPCFVAAASASSTGSPSLSLGSSNSGSGSSCSQLPSGISLRCLFCLHSHLTEKIHCQHLDRLRRRCISGEAYTGDCVVPPDHWLHLNFYGECSASVQAFIHQYVSHLASSYKHGVDPDRAARLHTWLDSLRKQ